MNNLATLTRQQQVGIIKINRPPVNALNSALLEELHRLILEVKGDAEIKALVLCAEGSTFVCGADIAEMTAPVPSPDRFNPLMDLIESLDRPVVAVLHGTALGGGLELAMACHYRVALSNTRIGLPEVTLGLLPGAGGTQRLPRLIGAREALDWIKSGKMHSAERGMELGLIDRIMEGDPAQAGVSYARDLLDGGLGPRPTRGLQPKLNDLDGNFFSKQLAEANAKYSAYPAVGRIVECVQAAVTKPFEDGQKLEQALFSKCLASSQSKALRHLFFAERNVLKIPGLPKSLSLRSIKKIGVVGAGTMGGGIAMNFLNAGIPTVIVENNQEALDRGVSIIRKNYNNTASKGRMTIQQVEESMALLKGSLTDADLADCDLVIEAVFENMEVKKSVCARLGKICKPGAIIATNTSTLDVDELGRQTGRPKDFLGMHFFSPANVMKLLEVVRGEATAPEVLATVMRLARTIGKIPVVSGVCYGFIGNRMLEGYLREADFLLLEGATPSQIDTAIEKLGLAMGPCRMLDMAGTDVAAKVVIEQGKAGLMPDDPSYRAVVRRLFELGRNGQKVGSGYYRYEGRNAIEDPDAIAMFEALASQFGISRRENITDQEIVERCMYPLINEGARILEEGIAYRPGDIDVVWVRGYGFPDYLGGPIFMADQIGLHEISKRMKYYAEHRGNNFGYWDVSKLILNLAAQSKRLSDATV